MTVKVNLPADFQDRLVEVLNCPTAPFHEGPVHKVIRAAVADSARLRDRVDAHGNLEVVYGSGRPSLWFTCHTDHPALESNGDGTARIVGGVRGASLVGATLRTFDPDGPHVTVTGQAGPKAKRPPYGGDVRIKGGRKIRKGTPLILALAGVRFTARHIRARAIDDGCAVAACLAAMDRLAAARFKGTVGFLFTRAEEVGFAGALGWVRSAKRASTTTVVNLEMSNALRHARQGNGPILRVGDRITTFGRDVSLGLEEVALKLGKRDKQFRYQRALMDGGACEATVYAHAGFRTGALCLPLKNYHNHAPGGRMGLEYVHKSDAENLVRWIVAYAKAFDRLDPPARIAKRLDSIWRKQRLRLVRSAAEGKGG